MSTLNMSFAPFSLADEYLSRVRSLMSPVSEFMFSTSEHPDQNPTLYFCLNRQNILLNSHSSLLLNVSIERRSENTIDIDQPTVGLQTRERSLQLTDTYKRRYSWIVWQTRETYNHFTPPTTIVNISYTKRLRFTVPT